MPNIGTIVESYHDGVLGELSAHLGDELDEELAVPVGHVQADELNNDRKMKNLGQKKMCTT